MREFLEIDEDFLRATLAVNLESVLWMCQGFIGRRLTQKQRGAIVNVSSIDCRSSPAWCPISRAFELTGSTAALGLPA